MLKFVASLRFAATQRKLTMLITLTMLIEITKPRLIETLNRAAATTATNTGNTMTAFFKLVVEDDKLTVSSTNLIASTIASTRCTVKTEGETVVNAARIVSVVSGFDDDAQIVLQITGKEKDTLTVRSGNRRYTIRVLDAAMFPNIAVIADSDSPITLNHFSLKTVFERVNRFISDERDFFNGVYMRTNGKTLEAFAFGNHHQARATIEIGETPEKLWFIPAELFRSASKIFNESETVEIDCGETFVSLKADGFLAGSRIPNATSRLSPDFEFVAERLREISDYDIVANNGVVMHVANLEKAINAVSIAAGKSGEVTLDAQSLTFGKHMVVSSVSPSDECSDATDCLPLLSEVKEFTFKVNLTYILNMLKSVGTGVTHANQIAMQTINLEGIVLPLLGCNITHMPDAIGTAAFIICPVVAPPPKKEK